MRVVRVILSILGIVAGLALVGVGLIGGLFASTNETRFLVGASLVPVGMLLLALGLSLLWLIVRARRNEIEPAVALPPWWLSALVFALALGLGWLAVRFGQWWLFLPLSVVVVGAPIAAWGRLGLSRGAPLPSWGRIVPAFAWGALVTPLIAITLQGIGGLGAIAAAVIGASTANPNNLTLLQRTYDRFLMGRTLTDAQTTALVQWVVRQPLVLVIGAFVLVFVGPASEELCKGGAAMLFGRTRPDRAQDSTLTIFLIGLAAGLGFATMENILYVAQGGATGGLTGWVAQALQRGVTPLMHGTASALFALGWARQRREPRGWGLVGGTAAAIGLHGAWNCCAGLLVVAALFTSERGNTAGLAVLLIILALGSLLLLALVSIVTLLRLRRTLAAEANAAATGGAIAPQLPPSPSYPTLDRPLDWREAESVPEPMARVRS